jgi:2-keto-3-deoxy-L-rhamnonate aldolase RhmA
MRRGTIFFPGESLMQVNRIREFKKKLRDDFVLGIFSKTSDPGFIEIMGYSGFDFVIIDLEHGPNSVQRARTEAQSVEEKNLIKIIFIVFRGTKFFLRLSGLKGRVASSDSLHEIKVIV